MKRFGLAVVVAAVSVLAISGSASAGGPYDSVSGAIKRPADATSMDRHFILSAHQTPNGAKGSYSAVYGKGGQSRIEYKGDVTCVNVVGNLAKVEILVTESTHPANQPVGYYEVLRITDYGNPSGDDKMDSLSPGAFTPAPRGCNAPFTVVTPTYSGNFSVNDAG